MSSKKISILKNTGILILIFQSFSLFSMAQITWPEGQLLPSFPSSAATQDLIYLNGSVVNYARTWRWQAEDSTMNHNTGQLQTNGWYCQVGVDTPNEYMVYGPNDKNVTSGPNVAEFRMLIDNNLSDDEPMVDVDVRNVTTGVILASQTVTRKQFLYSARYSSIKLPFVMPADSQAIELRVFWRGKSYIKVDYVSVTQDNAAAEMYLFSSMKGIVNMTQPRIFSYEGDAFAEGAFTWMQSLGLKYVENFSNWLVLSKYINEFSGIIVYDPAQIHTVNLATTLAKEKKALVASPALLSRLTASPYNLPILEDLRGKFNSKLEVYQELYDKYWPTIDHRLLIGLSPEYHKASLREYASALGAAVIWLDPSVSAESTLLNNFLSSMPVGSNFMGWWPEEAAGVSRASRYGIATIASDYATNLCVHSGMSRTVVPKPIPQKPDLENKLYVAFIISDGDNLQYVEHLMRKLWNNPDRGSVPMGWTLSPAMIDAMPGALNYYHKTSTENDNLISGPSGYGYAYPNIWPGQSELDQFVAKTEEYNVRAGFRVITVWNTITGGITVKTGDTFANNASTLLGLTAQNTGGPLSIYQSVLPGKPLSCNYCSSEESMTNHIASAAAGWDGKEPRFIIIQANPWDGLSPTRFKNVMNTLDANYKVVRPDHLFQLLREANGLTVNPGGIEGSGDGLKGTYYEGMNFETEVASKKDENVNFDWGTDSPMFGVSADNFSVRWTGQVEPRYSGNYTFYITSDNGRRVWINDKLIIDKWIDNAGTTYSDTISLTAGEKYNLKVEYFENNETANCKLEWASALQAREVIPQSQLYSDYSPNGVNDVAANSDIDIYPGIVTNGILNINMKNQNDKGEATLILYDLCGKAVSCSTVNESSKVDIRNLSAGTYIVSISTKENSFNRKIVVQ